jgi:hypothetical protein
MSLSLFLGTAAFNEIFFGGKMTLTSKFLYGLLALGLSGSLAYAEDGAPVSKEGEAHRAAEKPAVNKSVREAQNQKAAVAGREVRRESIQPRHQFQVRDVHRFNRDELVLWRGGRWNNTCYAGRCGWWWFAAGQWYFYDRPIYPYPLAVAEVVYAEPMVAVPMMPPPQVTYVPAPVPPPMPVQAPPKFLYYCDNPAGYFPAVQTCSTQFRQVAAPTGQVAAPPVPVVPPPGQ